MTSFTEEQEKEVQKRVAEAMQLEQYRTAGKQAFREAEMHLEQLVDQFDKDGNLVKRGAFDRYLLDVFHNEFIKFMNTYYGNPTSESTPEHKTESKPEDAQDSEDSVGE